MPTASVLDPPGDPAPAAGRPYGLRQWAGLAAGAAVLAGMLLAPPPGGLSVEGWRTAAVGALMAVWWMSEALPIAATALVPLVLFPLLGVAGMTAAAAPYANPLIFLFMGGFMLALAMERWGLHRRVALTIVRFMGTRPHAIAAGFMTATAFLSMWVSNSATAMMMLPIALSVVELVRREEREAGANFALVLMLVIAYGSSIGGMATLVGTPTNALLAGFMAEAYGVEISFARWLLLGGALMAVGLPVAYLVVARLVYPIRLREIPGGHAFIARELRALGPPGRAEKMVAAVFAATALLWITRPLLGAWLPGLTDPGIAMASALVLFVLPADARRGVFVLDWEHARRMPYGVLLLFGGGFSLADAVAGSGLAAWIGQQMALAAGWPLLLVMGAVVTVVVFLTELTSNTATAAAFLPILASVAVGLGHDPMVLAVPAALAASCAFMLPVATPPNAIVYGSGAVSVPQMVRAGFWLNLLFVGLVTALCYWLMPHALGLPVRP